MKKILPILFLAAMLVSAGLLAGKPHENDKIKSTHTGKKGLDGAPISCTYCHGASKANIKKQKGADLNTIKKGKYCAMNGCHPEVDKK